MQCELEWLEEFGKPLFNTGSKAAYKAETAHKDRFGRRREQERRRS